MRQVYGVTLIVLSTFFLRLQMGYAQPKTYKARIAPITESGYYSIEIDPRIIGATKGNLSKLRIFKKDSLGATEVPYFIREVQPTSKETKVKDYTIEKVMERDSINRFVIHNPEEKKITDFYVAIAKAEVSIQASVRGSNNKQDWFIVKQKTPIYSYVSSDHGEATLFIPIPEGHYTYYEIELINNQSAPLKLNKVSTAVDTKSYGQFSPTLLAYDASKTNKKEKTSTVSFAKQEMFYKLSKLVIHVDAPKAYYRKAVLRDSITKASVSFVLSSKNTNEFIVDDILVHAPYLEIYNGDNEPLTIKSINTYSLTRFATAYLKANETYEVEVNSSTSDSRDYDIEHFKQDIPLLLPIVQTEDFNQVDIKATSDESQKQKDRTNKILWGVLLTVGLLISYICYKTFKKLEQ